MALSTVGAVLDVLSKFNRTSPILLQSDKAEYLEGFGEIRLGTKDDVASDDEPISPGTVIVFAG